jgi:hypothetical protein
MRMGLSAYRKGAHVLPNKLRLQVNHDAPTPSLRREILDILYPLHLQERSYHPSFLRTVNQVNRRGFSITRGRVGDPIRVPR